MAIKNRVKVAKLALQTLRKDRDDRLLAIDRYEQGQQDLPFMPDNADAEYRLLAKRAVTNVIPFLISTPAQMMYGDSFRRGRTSDSLADHAVIAARTFAVQPEWDHWQKSGLDKRQSAVYRGALKFGHSFVLTEDTDKKGILSKGLSALSTVALYEDPANDEDPYVALSVKRWPKGDEVGLARMWDDTYLYWVTFKSLEDLDSVTCAGGKKHGATVCPVTRFTAAVDLEGRTCGVVEPMFVLQDRINQTVFDLLIVQSFASFKVRTIAGMAPPVKMGAYDEAGVLITDPAGRPDDVYEWRPLINPDTGRPIMDEVNLNAKRLFFAEDHETRFSTLDETPLDGFISAIDTAFRHMSSLSQTPPHFVLGEIANLSAEALTVAETALARKVDEFKTSFGESWERVFRVAAEIGELDGASDLAGELVWRDVGQRSLAQSADALGKLAESLGIPKRGLWSRVPNVTANELATWEDLREEDDPAAALASSKRGASTGLRPTFRRPVPAEPVAPAA